MGLPGLDTLGWQWSGDVAGVTRAILDGEPVAVVRSQSWPLPPLPKNVAVTTADAEPSSQIADDTPSRASSCWRANAARCSPSWRFG